MAQSATIDGEIKVVVRGVDIGSWQRWCHPFKVYYPNELEPNNLYFTLINRLLKVDKSVVCVVMRSSGVVEVIFCVATNQPNKKLNYIRAVRDIVEEFERSNDY